MLKSILERVVQLFNQQNTVCRWIAAMCPVMQSVFLYTYVQVAVVLAELLKPVDLN